jgi:hypothetical protein
MTGQNQTRRTLREVHGSDAEIIEMDAEGAATGRSYRLVKKDEWAWAPTWLRLLIGVSGLVVLVPIFIALVAAAAFVVWLLVLIVPWIFQG